MRSLTLFTKKKRKIIVRPVSRYIHIGFYSCFVYGDRRTIRNDSKINSHTPYMELIWHVYGVHNCRPGIVIIAFTTTFKGSSSTIWSIFLVKLCAIIIAILCYILSTRYFIRYFNISLLVQNTFNMIITVFRVTYICNEYDRYTSKKSSFHFIQNKKRFYLRILK